MKLYGSFFVLSILIFIISPLTASNGIVTGTGTIDSPFLIEDEEDFLKFCDLDFANQFWAQDTYTRLANSLDFREYPIRTMAYISPDTDNSNWDDFDGIPYNGTFNGNGCTIRSITIGSFNVSCCYLGVFGLIGSHGSVANLHLENVALYGAYDTRIVGSICGCNAGIVSDCTVYSVEINTSSNYNTGYGGFCGLNTGSINNCVVRDVKKSAGRCAHSFGGFCGSNSGSIQQCYARVSYFNCDDLTGGFCGSMGDGNIQNCYAISEKKIW